MTNQAITHRDTAEAFDDAIRNAGDLSAEQTAANWAGHYMYMGTEQLEDGRVEVDLFKHRTTRQYLRVRYDMN